ncbi:Neuroligin-4, X-linked [Pseudolycoriella hygida]|uniref:Neuroligin-4, X-linked n=1 Tax=Pseudolycoriella hygida TaxID=35572 RepID=A0A9Q0RY78_9DIPT|nr:Neuroligin-4, X-linked [Pseudolycoriella hygida]
MKWDAIIFFAILCFGVNECDTNITPLTETKKPCDKFATDARHQTNKQNVTTPEANDNTAILCDEDYQSDDYVVEDNELRQNDEPDRHLRFPYSYGSIRKQPPQYEKHRQQHHHHREDEGVEYTKEVMIKQGRLKGMVRRMHAQSGLRNVDQYLGIPYAAAQRFMPPAAPQPWLGVKITTTLSPVCPQNLPQLNATQNYISGGRYDQLKRLIPFLRDESEDCLFLNLYVPKWENMGPQPKFPVIIYIHGESYEWNSGNPYDGSVLASYGQVIVVTLNYRLGILGFLKPGTSDHTVSNFGLLDQIAALQWVKDNIGAFNGDNKAVTLMGHGTGAACVNLLMLSPIARGIEGLFHRAIIMSGSALSDWAIANHPLQATMQVIQALNCPLREDNEEMLICLRKKRYQEIVKTQIATPEFSTKFGPVVDNLVVPNIPAKVMSQYNDVFSRNAVGLSHGLLESERDSYLRFYMQNRFEIRPDIAMALTLQEYTDIYNNPERPLAEEHRDTVLEILSDARVASPLIQTGLYHSKVNPRSYMYVFGHNSKAGEFANLPQSINGEDLPYVFGAPLASAGPFQSHYSPEERLLSEAIMVYWTNFAKTGNPKAPWRDRFLNLEPKAWEAYDIDWPEFNAVNLNYLNIGIPPVVNQNFKQKYMTFWNQYLPEELNRTIYSSKSSQPYPNLFAPSLSVYTRGTTLPPFGAKVNYNPDKSTEDPLRTLKLLLNRPNLNRTDMYNTQSTVLTTTATLNGNGDSELIQHTATDNEIVVKADATLGILIAIVILFLLVNVVILFAYVIKRNYYDKTLKRKLDVLSLDGTTDDDVKRSKFNDGDESFILDVVRKKNDYEPVHRNRSPINGYLLSRELSTSTVDAHTKVCDWMSQEISKKSNKSKGVSPSFSMRSRGFFRRNGKVSVAVDATPSTRTASVLRQQPAELLQQPFNYENKDVIICEEVDVDASLIDAVNLRESLPDSNRRNSISSLGESADIIKIDHRHSRSDPVQTYYRSFKQDEDITVFIEDDNVNVTSRDEPAEREPLSPEAALKAIQMRNYPKVLPKYPKDSAEYVSSSVKRRSLPPQYFSMNSFKMPPVPPPRTTSTLGRRPSDRRDSKTITTSPIMKAEEPPELEEPEITCNTLHVGPLIPKSNESLYCAMRKKPSTPDQNKSFSFENSIILENISQADKVDENAAEQCPKPSGIKPPSGFKMTNLTQSDKKTAPKIIIKPTLNRQNSSDKKNQNIPRVQAPQDVSSAPLAGTSKIPKRKLSTDRAASDSSSSETSSSTTGTVKQIF